MARLIILLFSLVISACAEPKNETKTEATVQNYLNTKCQTEFCMSLYWQSDLKTHTLLNAKVITHSKSHILTLKNIEHAYLWMPSMGHGSSPIDIIKQDDGSWLLERAYFIMPGDWELRIKTQGSDEEFIWSYYL